MTYAMHLAVYFSVYATLALSLNLIVGYAGLLTLAHAGYFALGAYTYAIASLHAELGLGTSILLAASVSVVASVLLTLPIQRLKGDSFVLLSLAAQIWIVTLLQNWWSPDAAPGTWRNLTNGSFGLTVERSPSLLWFNLDTHGELAFVAGAVAVAAAVMVSRLQNSPWGRLLKAARDDETCARGLGKNTRAAQAQALTIGCALAAIAGTLYAAYVGFVDAKTASLDESIMMLSFVLIGGVGNFRGPIIGAVALLTIGELLRLADLPGSTVGTIRLLAYGALMVVMMHVRPQGIAGEYRFN